MAAISAAILVVAWIGLKKQRAGAATAADR
jgi:hypothetical protein